MKGIIKVARVGNTAIIIICLPTATMAIKIIIAIRVSIGGDRWVKSRFL